MALVMLPCDLPWWAVVCKKLNFIRDSTEVDPMLEHMLKLHDLCNVSLDPDEDIRDSTLFDGFRDFITTDMSTGERDHFFQHTLGVLTKRAQSLKSLRPPRGLHFSLQQHPETIELEYDLVAALLANAFFSTFPKRTQKTHPTLQDFNFTHFFQGLSSNSQKAKLRCFLHYFDWLEANCETVNKPGEKMKIFRKVMTGKEWLTIEDWLECGLPLCPLEIKHEGKIERSKHETVQTVFASPRLGGNVLHFGNSQECIQFFTFPELLAILIYAEALEDNETLLVVGVRQVAHIIDPKNKAMVEKLEEARTLTVCCMDAENYAAIPVHQFEEDNILRELNKCLLAFRQNSPSPLIETKERSGSKTRAESTAKRQASCRLSPIGESGTNSPRNRTHIVIKQASSSTHMSSYDSGQPEDIQRRRNYLSPDPGCNPLVLGPTASGRRGRFIVLGSSGECLPINRDPLSECGSGSVYSSCDSDSDEFLSAQGSVDDTESEDEGFAYKYSKELDTPEKRMSFAQKLKAALKQSNSFSDSTEDSSYAVDISISGSKTGDEGIRVRRGGSRGFVLTEDSLDDDFYNEALAHEKEWMHKFRNKQNGLVSLKKLPDDTRSKHSASSELSSELEEVYEQFSKWLEDPILKDKTKTLDPRDEAVLNFASSLLKRTLSESFVGVPLTDGCVTSAGISAEDTSLQNYERKRNRAPMTARSLSLELAKHKHRLAAQLRANLHCDNKSVVARCTRSVKRKIPKHCKWSIKVESQQTILCDDVTLKISQIGQRRLGTSDIRPVATGNWGCGHTCDGDVQLKMVIQWMAASVAGLPVLIYYTSRHERLVKLDTVCRVLLDRQWTVGELASASLMYAKEQSEDPNNEKTQGFFEKLIGI